MAGRKKQTSRRFSLLTTGKKKNIQKLTQHTYAHVAHERALHSLWTAAAARRVSGCHKPSARVSSAGPDTARVDTGEASKQASKQRIWIFIRKGFFTMTQIHFPGRPDGGTSCFLLRLRPEHRLATSGGFLKPPPPPPPPHQPSPINWCGV